jgi:primosomal replication protein N
MSVAELLTMKHHIFVTVQGGVAEVCEESFVVGAALRVAGYISESSLMSIFRAEVRKLLLLRKSLGI